MYNIMVWSQHKYQYDKVGLKTWKYETKKEIMETIRSVTSITRASNIQDSLMF